MTSARSTGCVGFKTRAAIGLKEKELGLPLTCYPTAKLVDAVLKEASAQNQRRQIEGFSAPPRA